MRAVGYRRPLPIDAADALLDLEVTPPLPAGRDLLVEVRAVSVNPVDVKTRARVAPPDGDVRILGYDASGIVVGAGPDVQLFRAGDAVCYAGSILRPGSNAELQVVDERIVGRKPQSLSFAQAAAMPLTTITAWELLFDRLQVRGDDTGDPADAGSLLIVGAAGGVGSVLTQLARTQTAMTVIGTASRSETRAWVESLGAHHVIDHRQPLSSELKRIGIPQVTHVASLTHTESHFADIVAALAPQGMIGVIDDPGALDVMLMKRKCLSLRWEAMFARSMFQTRDMIAQHALLDTVAGLIETGTIRSTMTEHFGSIDAAHLKKAHAFIERGRTIGKIVLEGF